MSCCRYGRNFTRDVCRTTVILYSVVDIRLPFSLLSSIPFHSIIGNCDCRYQRIVREIRFLIEDLLAEEYDGLKGSGSDTYFLLDNSTSGSSPSSRPFHDGQLRL
jgi:hypothetical protein